MGFARKAVKTDWGINEISPPTSAGTPPACRFSTFWACSEAAKAAVNSVATVRALNNMMKMKEGVCEETRGYIKL